MNKYILLSALIFVGCSTHRVPIDETYTSLLSKEAPSQEIDISSGEVERYLDSNGFFYIRGPFPEEKARWLKLTIWVLRYDPDMPRQCVGYIKPAYLTLFHDLGSILDDPILYKPERDDDELVIVNHAINYRLRLTNDRGTIFSSYVLASRDESPQSIIVTKAIDFFDSLGLDPFKWSPKTKVFKSLSCTK